MIKKKEGEEDARGRKKERRVAIWCVWCMI